MTVEVVPDNAVGAPHDFGWVFPLEDVCKSCFLTGEGQNVPMDNVKPKAVTIHFSGNPINSFDPQKVLDVFISGREIGGKTIHSSTTFIVGLDGDGNFVSWQMAPTYENAVKQTKGMTMSQDKNYYIQFEIAINSANALNEDGTVNEEMFASPLIQDAAKFVAEVISYYGIPVDEVVGHGELGGPDSKDSPQIFMDRFRGLVNQKMVDLVGAEPYQQPAEVISQPLTPVTPNIYADSPNMQQSAEEGMALYVGTGFAPYLPGTITIQSWPVGSIPGGKQYIGQMQSSTQKPDGSTEATIALTPAYIDGGHFSPAELKRAFGMRGISITEGDIVAAYRVHQGVAAIIHEIMHGATKREVNGTFVTSEAFKAFQRIFFLGNGDGETVTYYASTWDGLARQYEDFADTMTLYRVAPSLLQQLDPSKFAFAELLFSGSALPSEITKIMVEQTALVNQQSPVAGLLGQAVGVLGSLVVTGGNLLQNNLPPSLQPVRPTMSTPPPPALTLSSEDIRQSDPKEYYRLLNRASAEVKKSNAKRSQKNHEVEDVYIHQIAGTKEQWVHFVFVRPKMTGGARWRAVDPSIIEIEKQAMQTARLKQDYMLYPVDTLERLGIEDTYGSFTTLTTPEVINLPQTAVKINQMYQEAQMPPESASSEQAQKEQEKAPEIVSAEPVIQQDQNLSPQAEIPAVQEEAAISQESLSPGGRIVALLKSLRNRFFGTALNSSITAVVDGTPRHRTPIGVVPEQGEILIAALKPHEVTYVPESVQQLREILDQGGDLDPVMITEYQGVFYTLDGVNRVLAQVGAGRTSVPYQFVPYEKLTPIQKIGMETLKTGIWLDGKTKFPTRFDSELFIQDVFRSSTLITNEVRKSPYTYRPVVPGELVAEAEGQSWIVDLLRADDTAKIGRDCLSDASIISTVYAQSGNGGGNLCSLFFRAPRKTIKTVVQRARKIPSDVRTSGVRQALTAFVSDITSRPSSDIERSLSQQEEQASVITQQTLDQQFFGAMILGTPSLMDRIRTTAGIGDETVQIQAIITEINAWLEYSTQTTTGPPAPWTAQWASLTPEQQSFVIKSLSDTFTQQFQQPVQVEQQPAQTGLEGIQTDQKSAIQALSFFTRFQSFVANTWNGFGKQGNTVLNKLPANQKNQVYRTIASLNQLSLSAANHYLEANAQKESIPEMTTVEPFDVALLNQVRNIIRDYNVALPAYSFDLTSHDEAQSSWNELYTAFQNHLSKQFDLSTIKSAPTTIGESRAFMQSRSVREKIVEWLTLRLYAARKNVRDVLTNTRDNYVSFTWEVFALLRKYSSQISHWFNSQRIYQFIRSQGENLKCGKIAFGQVFAQDGGSCRLSDGEANVFKPPLQVLSEYIDSHNKPQVHFVTGAELNYTKRQLEYYFPENLQGLLKRGKLLKAISDGTVEIYTVGWGSYYNTNTIAVRYPITGKVNVYFPRNIGYEARQEVVNFLSLVTLDPYSFADINKNFEKENDTNVDTPRYLYPDQISTALLQNFLTVNTAKQEREYQDLEQSPEFKKTGKTIPTRSLYRRIKAGLVDVVAVGDPEYPDALILRTKSTGRVQIMYRRGLIVGKDGKPNTLNALEKQNGDYKTLADATLDEYVEARLEKLTERIENGLHKIMSGLSNLPADEQKLIVGKGAISDFRTWSAIQLFNSIERNRKPNRSLIDLGNRYVWKSEELAAKDELYQTKLKFEEVRNHYEGLIGWLDREGGNKLKSSVDEETKNFINTYLTERLDDLLNDPNLTAFSQELGEVILHEYIRKLHTITTYHPSDDEAQILVEPYVAQATQEMASQMKDWLFGNQAKGKKGYVEKIDEFIKDPHGDISTERYAWMSWQTISQKIYGDSKFGFQKSDEDVLGKFGLSAIEANSILESVYQRRFIQSISIVTDNLEKLLRENETEEKTSQLELVRSIKNQISILSSTQGLDANTFYGTKALIMKFLEVLYSFEGNPVDNTLNVSSRGLNQTLFHWFWPSKGIGQGKQQRDHLKISQGMSLFHENSSGPTPDVSITVTDEIDSEWVQVYSQSRSMVYDKQIDNLTYYVRVIQRVIEGTPTIYFQVALDVSKPTIWNADGSTDNYVSGKMVNLDNPNLVFEYQLQDREYGRYERESKTLIRAWSLIGLASTLGGAGAAALTSSFSQQQYFLPANYVEIMENTNPAVPPTAGLAPVYEAPLAQMPPETISVEELQKPTQSVTVEAPVAPAPIEPVSVVVKPVQPQAGTASIIQPESELTESLQATLDTLVTGAPGVWTYYVHKIGSNETFSSQANESFHPASTIKLPIALALFTYIEDSGVPVEEALSKRIEGVGSRTLRQLLEAMLIHSEEEATEIISQYVNSQPGYRFSEIFYKWGVDGLSVYPRQATAESTGKLLEKFYTKQLGLSDKSTDLLLGILRTSSKDDKRKIGRPLPAEILSMYAHKGGTILGDDGVYTSSDTGIVTLPNGEAYVFVVFNSFENSDQNNQVEATINEMSSAVLKAYWPEYREQQKYKDSTSTLFIDPGHSNIGRLNNLLEVGERLDGVVIPAGQTVEISEYVFASLDGYIDGYAYSTEEGVAIGGGICGAAGSLAKASELAGLEWQSEAHHFPKDHSAGGLYENFPNASFSYGKSYTITNTKPYDVVIKISANYTKADIQGKGEWNTFINAQETIKQSEFTFTIELEQIDASGKRLPIMPIVEAPIIVTPATVPQETQVAIPIPATPEVVTEQPVTLISAPLAPMNQGGPLSLEQKQLLYASSLNYVAETPEQVMGISAQYLTVNQADGSNICGPLSAKILQDTGLLSSDINVHQFWFLDPRPELGEGFLEKTFPKDTYDWIDVPTSIDEYNFSRNPLQAGDLVYLRGGDFTHWLTVSRVDEQGRAYAVSNVKKGYVTGNLNDTTMVITEVLLYDPANPDSGMFQKWTDTANKPLHNTGYGGLQIWRLKIGTSVSKPLEIGTSTPAVTGATVTPTSETASLLQLVSGQSSIDPLTIPELTFTTPGGNVLHIKINGDSLTMTSQDIGDITTALEFLSPYADNLSPDEIRIQKVEQGTIPGGPQFYGQAGNDLINSGTKWIASFKFTSDYSTSKSHLTEVMAQAGKSELTPVASLIHELVHTMKYKLSINGTYEYNPMRGAFENTFYKGISSVGEYDPALITEKPPTDYSASYQDALKTGETNLERAANEDLADTIALYLTAPEYLKEKAPLRYEFAEYIANGGDPMTFSLVENVAGTIQFKSEYLAYLTPRQGMMMPFVGIGGIGAIVSLTDINRLSVSLSTLASGIRRSISQSFSVWREGVDIRRGLTLQQKIRRGISFGIGSLKRLNTLALEFDSGFISQRFIQLPDGSRVERLDQEQKQELRQIASDYKDEITFADQVLSRSKELRSLSSEELRALSLGYETRLINKTEIDDATLTELMALFTESLRRQTRLVDPNFDFIKYPEGIMLFRSQLITAYLALHGGNVIESPTGSGKQYVTAAISYIRSFISPEGVHVATSDDALAERDAKAMASVYNLLGLHVGYLTNDREGQRDAHIVTYDAESNKYIGLHRNPVTAYINPETGRRSVAIQYIGGLARLGFDVEDSQQAMFAHTAPDVRLSRASLVLDEIDKLLIDEATQQMIQASPNENTDTIYSDVALAWKKLLKIANAESMGSYHHQLDKYINSRSKDGIPSLTRQGWRQIAVSLEEGALPEYLLKDDSEENVDLEEVSSYTDKQIRYMAAIEQVITTYYSYLGDIYHREQLSSKWVLKLADGTTYGPAEAYSISTNLTPEQKSGARVIPLDSITGYEQPGRRFQNGAHQALEALLGIPVQSENTVWDRLSVQMLVQMYGWKSGLTGTAIDAEKEFAEMYNMGVTNVPKNWYFEALNPKSSFVKVKRNITVFNGKTDVTEQQYGYVDMQSGNQYWERVDLPDRIFQYFSDLNKYISEEALVEADKGRSVVIFVDSLSDIEKLQNDVSNAESLVGWSRYQSFTSTPRVTVIPPQLTKAEQEVMIKSYVGKPGITITNASISRGAEIKIDPSVRQAGGMHVIVKGVKLKRVMDQMFGRAARNGDPGTARLFWSLQDSYIEERYDDEVGYSPTRGWYKKMKNELDRAQRKSDKDRYATGHWTEIPPAYHQQAQAFREKVQARMDAEDRNIRFDDFEYNIKGTASKWQAYNGAFLLGRKTYQDVLSQIRSLTDPRDFLINAVRTATIPYVDAFGIAHNGITILNSNDLISLSNETNLSNEQISNRLKLFLHSQVVDAWQQYLSELDAIRLTIQLDVMGGATKDPLALYESRAADALTTFRHRISEGITNQLLVDWESRARAIAIKEGHGLTGNFLSFVTGELSPVPPDTIFGAMAAQTSQLAENLFNSAEGALINNQCGQSLNIISKVFAQDFGSPCQVRVRTNLRQIRNNKYLRMMFDAYIPRMYYAIKLAWKQTYTKSTLGQFIGGLKIMSDRTHEKNSRAQGRQQIFPTVDNQ